MDLILKVNAGAYSFEAANPRHEHEYHVWETVKLPSGKVIIPGVITHASNIVEHPELIAERITRFAKLVGRENVIAGVGLWFFFSSHLQPGGSSDCRVGQVPGDGGRRAPGDEAALALINSAVSGFYPAT